MSKQTKRGDCAKAGRDLATKGSSAAGRRLAACKLPADGLACKIAAWRLSVLGSPRAAKVLAGCGLEHRGNPGMRGCCNECIPGEGLTRGGKSVPVCVKKATCDRVGPDGQVQGYCGEHGKGKAKPPAGWGEPSSRRNPPARSLRVIAGEIRRDWKDPYFGAEPYIRAMADIDSVESYYGDDRGSDIVNRFLANAAKWRGDKAKSIKNELRAMVGLRVVKNPGCFDDSGEVESDLFEGDDLVECPMCEGPAGSLGTLGNVDHCQCRNCGWEFVRTESVTITTIDTIGNPGGVDPRLRREGTVVEFDGFGSGYSRAPAVGERGKVTTVPVPGGRSTSMRGPGGGLIYVDWDEIGVTGIAPQDLKVISGPPAKKAAAPQLTAASTRQEYDRARYELEVFHLNSVAEMRAVERAVAQGAYSVADEEGMSVRLRYDSMEGLRAGYGRLVRGIRANGWRISWGAYDLRTHQSVLREIEEPATRGNPSVREGSGVEVLHTRRGGAPSTPPAPRRGRPPERPVDLLQNDMRNLADRENIEEGRFYSGPEWAARRTGSASNAALVWVQEYIAGAVSLGERFGADIEEKIQKAARRHGYYMELANAEVMAFYKIDGNLGHADNPGRASRPWQQLYDRDGDRFTLPNGTRVSVVGGRDEDVGDQSFLVAVPEALWDRNEFGAMRELERALGPLSEKYEKVPEHSWGRDGSFVFRIHEALGGKRHWAR